MSATPMSAASSSKMCAILGDVEEDVCFSFPTPFCRCSSSVVTNECTHMNRAFRAIHSAPHTSMSLFGNIFV